MEPEFREAVARLTGRRVVAFISGDQIDPDMAAELFVLDARPSGGRSRRAGGACAACSGAPGPGEAPWRASPRRL